MKSRKPKKQRKAFHEKPLHRKQKELSAHLHRKLAEELGFRSIALRKGDTVKILRGDYKGKGGKISRVDISKGSVFVEKISRKKADGTEVLVPLQHSNLLVESIDRSDEKRFKRLKRAKEKAVEGKKAGEGRAGEERTARGKDEEEKKAAGGERTAREKAAGKKADEGKAGGE